MKVLCHLDPAVLERELIRRAAECGVEQPARGPLIVVPTARLREHLQRRLTRSRRAWLGLEVLHFRGLARRILDRSAQQEPRMISARLLDALLGRILRAQRDNAWSRFVARRPGAIRALSRSFRELREAGLGVEDLRASVDASGPQADLVPLFGAYCSALADLARRGWADDCGLVEAALPHAEGFAAGRAAILLHGAYELVGIQLDLLRALDRGREVVALWPYQPGAPGTVYGASFAERHLGGGDDPAEALESNELGRRLAAMWNEESRPVPDDEGRFAFRHAQGAAAEVRLAVRLALKAVLEGCPPSEILIVARGLTPYTEAIETTFEDEELPWTTSMATPLRRQPAIHDLMLVLEILAEDFPRRATAEALRSPRIRWKALLDGGDPPRGDRADRWSRQAGIVGGFEEWTEVLESWAAEPDHGGSIEERVEETRRIGGALGALRDRVRPARARRWSEHADDLARLSGDLIDSGDEAGGAALETFEELVHEMRGLESLAGSTAPVPFAEMVRWLADAVDGTELALRHEDDGGLRVLDAMQARGLTCRRLILLGMNSGQWPHPPREDSVLPDALRLRLRERTGRPIPVKAEGVREERMLLAMLLGAAADGVDVSWQRADESGRARTPSLALRELARLTLGRPDLEALVRAAEHVPSHPEQWLEWLSSRQGLMNASQARLLTVFRARRPSPDLARLYPELAAGLTQLRATESFHEIDPAYDGRVGVLAQGIGTQSVSALERLGRCPLQHFFAHRLRVHELDDEAGAFDVDRRDLGGRIHRLLEEVYGELAGEGLFESSKREELVVRGRALVGERWSAVMQGMERRISRRAPALWSMIEKSWLGSILLFVERDLDRIAAKGWGAPRLEHDAEGVIDIGGGRSLAVRGRFDRRFEGPEGPIVGDYKTGGIDRLGQPRLMLRGERLQVPLYSLLAGKNTTVEVSGVGPDHFDPQVGDFARIRFEGFGKDDEREGFLETLRTLVTLLEEGRFPVHPDTHCNWCDWSLACRLRHPPTLERDAHAPDTEEYRLTQYKNTRKPTLAHVRGRR